MKRTTKQIIEGAQHNLRMAKLSLDDYPLLEHERRISALCNFVTYGKSVIDICKDLSRTEPDFMNWIAPIRKEIDADELIHFFVKLRSAILKEGDTGTSHSFVLNSFNSIKFIQQNPPPVNSTGHLYIGDKFGRSGWEIINPDGSLGMHYLMVDSRYALYFRNPPKSHLGKSVVPYSIFGLCKVYYDYLENMLNKIKNKYQS